MRQDMLKQLTPSHCIVLMPVWQGHDIKVLVLSGGITNKLYRVDVTDVGQFVVRVYGEKTELFINRHHEMQNIKQLASSGVTAKLVSYLPEHHVTIVAYVPGTTACNADFKCAIKLPQLVNSIQSLHRSGAVLPKIFNPLEQVQTLYALYQKMGIVHHDFDIPKIMTPSHIVNQINK